MSTAHHDMHVYRDGKLFAHLPISSGRPGDDTPNGTYLTIEKANPVEMWRIGCVLMADVDHKPRSFDSARAIFERLMRVFNERDVAMIATVYTEDVEYRDDAWPEVVRGHAGVQRLFSALWQMSGDCRFDLIDGPYLSQDGRHAAVRWRVSGTMSGRWKAPRSPAFAPTGSRFAGEIGGFYELEGDRISEGRVIANQLDMGVQFGAVPPPGSRGELVGALMQRVNARRMRRRGDA